MDKRRFNKGGSRKGAGRKKGSGFSNLLKKYVDEFMNELLKDDKVKSKIQKRCYQRVRPEYDQTKASQ